MVNKNNFYRVIKIFFDLLVATLLTILLFPLFLIISILILSEDGFPIIFKQKRVGFGGKLFTMYKFRSMKKNSAKEGDKYYCFKGDKRITKIGFYLRKYSLDELPQFLNILRLEMSFIGPRPAIHDELFYEKIHQDLVKVIKLRTQVKPGITGYSQVISRNDLNWNEKLNLDNKYLSMNERKRLITDFIIIFYTIREIFFSKGIFDKR